MSYRVDRKTKTNSDDAKNNAVLVTVDSNQYQLQDARAVRKETTCTFASLRPAFHSDSWAFVYYDAAVKSLAFGFSYRLHFTFSSKKYYTHTAAHA